MVRAGVHDAQGIAQLLQVQGQIVDHRLGRVGEVDEHHAAHGGGRLVHQARGLAEIDVLGVLADLGNGHGGELLVEEQLVENGPDEDLKGGGGAEAAAGEDRRTDLGVEALELCAPLGKGGGHAADQGGGGVLLLGVDGEVGERNLHRRISLGGHGNDAPVIERHLGHGLQVDGGGQDAAVLMIGMVAADFRAARRGEMKYLHRILPRILRLPWTTRVFSFII